MYLNIPISPLSTNKTRKGRHHKTPEYIKYELDVTRLLHASSTRHCSKEKVVFYRYYIKNYKLTDTGNLEKPITDILVKLGYFQDDRFIKLIIGLKMPCDSYQNEKIECFAVDYEEWHATAILALVQGAEDN